MLPAGYLHRVPWSPRWLSRVTLNYWNCLFTFCVLEVTKDVCECVVSSQSESFGKWSTRPFFFLPNLKNNNKDNNHARSDCFASGRHLPSSTARHFQLDVSQDIFLSYLIRWKWKCARTISRKILRLFIHLMMPYMLFVVCAVSLFPIFGYCCLVTWTRAFLVCILKTEKKSKRTGFFFYIVASKAVVCVIVAREREVVDADRE